MTGKPKFDRIEVLDKAMLLFWQKGYHAVTTRDIQDFLGMHPGSVYAAFGGKADMFKETLKAYTNRVMSELDEAMAAHDTVSEGFESFFRDTLDSHRQGQPSNMCMLSMTLRDSGDDPELAAYTADLLSQVAGKFRLYVDQAIDTGEFVKPKNMRADVVRYLQVQLLGLRTAVSNGLSGPERDELIGDIFRRLRPLN